MSIIINGGGSGGGIASKVATTTAATVSCYSALKTITTTAVNVKSWLPNNSVINDIVIQSDEGNGVKIQVSATDNGGGPRIGAGGAFSSTQSYDLFVKTLSGTAAAYVMITYTT